MQKKLLILKLSDLVVNEVNNSRIEYQTEPLEAYIRENGIPGELEAYKDTDGKYYLTDGYRRCRAIRNLGGEFLNTELPVLVYNKLDNQTAESLLTQVTKNSGKPLTGFELATVFRGLESEGVTLAEMARRSGLSAAYISNLIDLSYAPGEVLDAIKQGEINVSNAIKALKSNETGNGADIIQDAKERIEKPAKIKQTANEPVNSTPAKTSDKRAIEAIEAIYAETGNEALCLLAEYLLGNVSREVVITAFK